MASAFRSAGRRRLRRVVFSICGGVCSIVFDQAACAAGLPVAEALRRKLVKQGRLNYVNGKKNSLDEIDFCPKVKMRIVEPWAMKDLSDTNDRSVGVWLKYRETSFLLVGDMEAAAEQVLLDELDDADRKMLKVDVLKVGHHGSDTSSTARFVKAVSPEHAIISSGQKEVGTNVGYKHPRLSTVRTFNDTFSDRDENGRVWAYDKANERWRQQARREGLWVTTKDGSVGVTSDGEKIRVKTKKN